jgi:hypothetical protein
MKPAVDVTDTSIAGWAFSTFTRTDSFCAHAILQRYVRVACSFQGMSSPEHSGDEPMVVPDTLADWRFAKNVRQILFLNAMG